MKHTVTSQISLVFFYLLLFVGLAFLWTQLPDAKPSHLRQECKNNLQQIYLALIVLGQKQNDIDESNSKYQIGSYLSNKDGKVSLQCPSVINGEHSNTDGDYYFNPSLSLRRLAENDYVSSTILVCDKLENHMDKDVAMVNFLLSDGSVISITVDAQIYKKWFVNFSKGVPEALHFPIEGLEIDTKR